MQTLLEETRRSTLIFVASGESTKSTYFYGLRRMREPVSRAKLGVQGKVADVFNARSRHAESRNELHAFRILLATARADAWQEQPCVLEYHQGEKIHRYTPDLLVVWGARHEVVEIKADAEADLPENQARFTLIRALLNEHGYHFRLWKKSQICAEPPKQPRNELGSRNELAPAGSGADKLRAPGRCSAACGRGAHFAGASGPGGAIRCIPGVRGCEKLPDRRPAT